MATHEEHITQLEQLLDNSTVNFHRFISKAVGGDYNGTAFGAVCIGWEGYPTHGGLYKGYFDFHAQRNTMLVVKAGGMFTYDGNRFLRSAGEGGRGHTIRYLSSKRLPARKRKSGLDGPDTSWFDSLDASHDIHIDDTNRPRVEEIIKEVKESEFWTLRKYAMQTNVGTGSFQLYNDDAFKGLVGRMFTDVPTPGAVVRFQDARYFIRELPSADGLGALVLEPHSAEYTVQTVPAAQLKMDDFNSREFRVGAEMPDVVLSVTSDKDASIATNWRVAGIGYGRRNMLNRVNEPRTV